MTLIIRKEGITIRLEKRPFENEAALQKYIYECPEAIPLDEVSPGAKLFVLAREFRTSSGPIDVLGTDQNGHPYIIETKLYKNPDKRLVLAQILDYGAALRANPPSANLLLETLRDDAAKRHRSEPVERLTAFLDSHTTSTERHLAAIAEALAEGRFTAVVLMDHLSQRLRDLISFLNENSRFQLLAVELDYYNHDGSEIVSPRLYGAEVRRNAGVKDVGGDPDQWFKDWTAKFGQPAANAWQSFLPAALTSGISELCLGYYNSGMPYLYLSETPLGTIALFRLATAKPEIRDELFRHAAIFDANLERRKLRDHFRSAIKQAVPEAYEGGSARRVFAPIEAVEHHKDAVIKAIAEFADSLQSNRQREK
jgi:hypothetical protein